MQAAAGLGAADHILGQVRDVLGRGGSVGDVINHLTGSGYGGSRQNAGNIGSAQQQTQGGYDAARDNTRTANDELLGRMSNMNDAAYYRGVATGNMQRQADFTNNMAINDQASRAALASDAIRSYDNARSANANFIASLNQAGAGRMY